MPRKSDRTNPTDTGILSFGEGWEKPFREMIVRFETIADVDDFERLIGQQIPPTLRTIWHPSRGEVLDLDRPDKVYLGDLDDSDRPWFHEWQQMPECVNSSIITGRQDLTVNFASAEDVEDFKKAIGQDFSDRAKSIWHPAQERKAVVGQRRYLGTGLNPRYPIYVPSKGRWETPLTARSLDRISVPFRYVVEGHEYDSYVAALGEERVLQLPWSKPGEPMLMHARNWIMEHSIEEGHARHWQLDDNLKGFYRYNRNEQTPVTDGTMFLAAEDFADRYENVGQAGFQYFMFVPRKRKYPSFSQNVRIYSCTLNNNALPMRYRATYNDDTDFSIQVLKGGWCTVLYNAFLADKMATMMTKGGNTESHKEGGRLKMAEELVELHPDIASIQWRWNRWQHDIDYRPIRGNRLRLKEGVVIEPGVNNYGLQLQKKVGEEWVDIPENPAYDREVVVHDYQEEMF